jgi:hypothetical protein
MNNRNWGGKRPNQTGRPKSGAPKRTRRAVEYFDEEWEIVKAKAKRRGMSAREYLYWLVNQDVESTTHC